MKNNKKQIILFYVHRFYSVSLTFDRLTKKNRKNIQKILRKIVIFQNGNVFMTQHYTGQLREEVWENILLYNKPAHSFKQ